MGPLIDIVSGFTHTFSQSCHLPGWYIIRSGAGLLYTINPNNGLCTPLFSTNVFNINGLVCSPDNILYGISNNPLPQSLIEIDPASSTSTNLGPLNFWAGSDLVFLTDNFIAFLMIGLYIVNIGNPLASTFVFHCGNYPALTVLPGYCNSLLGSDLDGQFFQINPDTQEETLIYSPGQYILILPPCLNLIRRPNVPLLLIWMTIIAAEQMSMIFNGPIYNCNTSDGAPICDQDVKITSDIKILSITITLEDGILDGLAEYLKFEGNVPFINVLRIRFSIQNPLYQNNATTTSFENAFKIYFYTTTMRIH